MKRAAFLLLALFSIAPLLSGQTRDNVALGFNPNRMYQFGDVDHVNLMNGDLVINVPVGMTYGVDEALSLQLGVTYNSKVWNFVDDTDPNFNYPNGGVFSRAFPEPRSNAGLGWRLSLGQLLPPWHPHHHSAAEEVHSWQYIGPAGDEHDLGFYCKSFTDCNVTYPAGDVAYTLDSTYISMYLNGTNAYVNFPSGEVRKFSLIHDEWRLVEIRSAFGRAITVDYEFNPLDAHQIVRWVIKDPVASRTHYVYFRSMDGSDMNITDDYGRIVDYLDFQTVNGERVQYRFDYGTAPAEVRRPCEQTHLWLNSLDGSAQEPQNIKLPLLRSISLPDGSSWSFSYYGTSINEQCKSGLVSRMTLPTRGTFDYDYGQWTFPPQVLCDNGANASIRISSGILSRIIDGTAEWRYYHDYAPETSIADDHVEACPLCPDGNNGLQRDPLFCSRTGPTTQPSRWLRTSVLNPRKDRTDYYFSGWATWPADPRGFGSRNSEYGLPFTRGMYDTGSTTHEHETKDNDGRYLSTQIFEKCESIQEPDPNFPDDHLGNNGPCTGQNVKLMRTTYVKYDHDGADPEAAQLNARVVSDRTEYNDDATGCTPGTGACGRSDTNRSDFDTLGHYRTEKTNGNFAGIHEVTSYTNYNPGNRPQVSWTPGTPPPITGWNLGVFTEQSRTDDRSSGPLIMRSLSCFDPASGFLLRRRAIKNTTTGAAGSEDVITTYGRTTSGATATIVEQTFGGDDASVGSDDASTFCAVDFSAPGAPAPQYRTDYKFTSGIMTSAQLYDGTTAKFLSINRLADDSTGVVTSGKDAAGVETQYDYDNMGRLKTISHPTGNIASTSYTYSQASASAYAYVEENTASAIGAKRQWQFDRLGRLWREKNVVPDGSWTMRETLYDGMGWKKSVSEPATLPGVNDDAFQPPYKTVFEYDAFGRPLSITAPDNTKTTMTYSGVGLTSRTVKVATGPLVYTDATTDEIYDRFGRLVDVKEPNGVHTAYGYDPAGNLTDVCMNTSLAASTPCTTGQPRTFKYDGRGFLFEERHPESGLFHYKYDARGHVTRKYRDDITDFNLQFTYDFAEHLRAVTGGVSSSPVKSFDYGENDVTSTDRNMGKLVKATRHNYVVDSGVSKDYIVTDRYYYEDPAGRLKRKVTEIYDPAISATKSVEQSQTYNDLSQPDTITYPHCLSGCDGSTWTVANAFTKTMLTSVAAGGSDLARFAYSPSGVNREIQHVNPSGSVTDTYNLDSMSRMSSIQFQSFQCASPVITSVTSTSWTPGSSVTLTVQAAGQAPLAYQWYDASTNQAIPGATFSSHTTGPVSSGGQWFVRVSNICGRKDSTVITVGTPGCSGPTIDTHPASQTITSGGAVSLSVGLHPPTTAPSFQWSQSTDSGATWMPVGTNSPSLDLTNITVTTWFRVVVTDCSRQATSNTAIVTVSTSSNLPAPAWLDAHAISTTSVVNYWPPVSGAGQYIVYRRLHLEEAWTYRATIPSAACTATQCTFSDSGALAATTYQYGVVASDTSYGHLSPFTADLATTISFTPLVQGSTAVSRSQFDELLNAVNSARSIANLPALQWSNILQPAGTSAPGLHVSVIAEHILALRREMNNALQALGVAPKPYTDPSLSAVAPRAIHVRDLQQQLY